MKTRLNHLPTRVAGLGLLLVIASSALADVHYVDVNSINATPPYTNWTTAATNIQDAVDAAVAGDEVVVTNGSYSTGWRVSPHDGPFDGPITRVVVDKPLSVRSVNGPQFTTVEAPRSLDTRCVYLTNSSRLSGFTLTNGLAEHDGGGVFCESQTAVVSNCILTGNYAQFGGGAYGGTLNNCTLTNNSSGNGGGAAYCTLNNCTLTGNSGSGVAYCTLNTCTLSGNTGHGENHVINTYDYGGGAFNSTLNNCTLTGNSAQFHSPYSYGGGTYNCTLNNCTLVGNSAFQGGGASGGTLKNCIVYFNTASGDANYDSYNMPAINYSCTTPQPTNGFGNITSEPVFVATNGWAKLRLQPNSPCINAGKNSYVTNATDLDGNLRISGGTVDIGAYEFQWPQLTIAPSGQTSF